MSRLSFFDIGSKESIKELIDSFKTIDEDECWLWKGALVGGYGVISIKYIMYKVHRLSAYVYLDLDINDKNIHVLHKKECKNKHCFNPKHLYLGDDFDNMRDKSELIQATLLFPCGHERNGYNLYEYDGYYGKKAYRCRRCVNVTRSRRRQGIYSRERNIGPNAY